MAKAMTAEWRAEKAEWCRAQAARNREHLTRVLADGAEALGELQALIAEGSTDGEALRNAAERVASLSIAEKLVDMMLDAEDAADML